MKISKLYLFCLSFLPFRTLTLYQPPSISRWCSSKVKLCPMTHGQGEVQWLFQNHLFLKYLKRITFRIFLFYGNKKKSHSIVPCQICWTQFRFRVPCSVSTKDIFQGHWWFEIKVFCDYKPYQVVCDLIYLSFFLHISTVCVCLLGSHFIHSTTLSTKPKAFSGGL